MAAQTRDNRMGRGREGSPWRVELLADTAALQALISAPDRVGEDREIHVQLMGVMPSWPSDEEIAQLIRTGVVEIDVSWEVELGADNPEGTMAFLRFLRDAMSHGLSVRWGGQIGQGLPVWVVSHLIPPSKGAALQPDHAAALWRAAYRYGQLYWRKGPHFVLVKDTWIGRDAARFTLDDPAWIDLFMELMQPAPIRQDGIAEETQQVLAALVAEHLVLQLGGWLVALPYRMRRWPIPYMAI